MIKEKELIEMRPRVRYKDGTNITLEVVQAALMDYFNNAVIPVAFRADEIKFGGLIGGSTEKCAVLYHPEHEKDYFKIAITVQHQGNFAYVTVNVFGSSKQLFNQGSADCLKETMKSDASTSEKVGALVGAGIRRLVKGGANKQKIQEEQDWYSFVKEAFDEIVS